jgi:arsenate reductase (glutaredoxin)
MNVEIYHNPSCTMSRNALRLIRETGVEPRIIEYLETPPSRAELLQRLHVARVPVREILRSKESQFADLGLADKSLPETAMLDALDAHPILMQRPIVVTPLGVNVCRPPELVLALLQNAPPPDTKREDGSDFLIDEKVELSPRLVSALTAEGMPSAALDGSTIYRMRSLAGTEIGYAGIRIEGRAALLTAFTVVPAERNKRSGRNMMHLLLRRAYDLGAREISVTTDKAAGFFRSLGFEARGTLANEWVRPLSLQVT